MGHIKFMDKFISLEHECKKRKNKLNLKIAPVNVRCTHNKITTLLHFKRTKTTNILGIIHQSTYMVLVGMV